jgi:hypothetical protein
MKLSGSELETIRNAIKEAFPSDGDELRILVDDADIGISFTDIQGEYEARIQTLLKKAAGKYQLTKFLKKAVERAPENPKLVAIASFVEKYFRFLPTFLPGKSSEKDEFLRNAEAKLFKSFTFQNVLEWLDKLDRFRRVVCRIEPQPPMNSKKGYGTGFLVAPDVILTANHIASGIQDRTQGFWDDQGRAELVRVRFDCYYGPDGNATCGREYKLAPDFKILRDKELDFAFLKLDSTNGKPGDEIVEGKSRSFATLIGHSFKEDDTLLILQHPDAEPMKLALGPLAEKRLWQKDCIAHRVETLRGSSGSPCLTEELKVCGLHIAGKQEKANYAVLMSSIIDVCKKPDNKTRLEGLVTIPGAGSTKGLPEVAHTDPDAATNGDVPTHEDNPEYPRNPSGKHSRAGVGNTTETQEKREILVGARSRYILAILILILVGIGCWWGGKAYTEGQLHKQIAELKKSREEAKGRADNLNNTSAPEPIYEVVDGPMIPDMKSFTDDDVSLTRNLQENKSAVLCLRVGPFGQTKVDRWQFEIASCLVPVSMPQAVRVSFRGDSTKPPSRTDVRIKEGPKDRWMLEILDPQPQEYVHVFFAFPPTIGKDLLQEKDRSRLLHVRIIK